MHSRKVFVLGTITAIALSGFSQPARADEQQEEGGCGCLTDYQVGWTWWHQGSGGTLPGGASNASDHCGYDGWHSDAVLDKFDEHMWGLQWRHQSGGCN